MAAHAGWPNSIIDVRLPPYRLWPDVSEPSRRRIWRPDMHMQFRLTLVLVAAIAVAGCKAIGPGSVQRDRLDYANAIGGSWKEQALLNIVKLRYFDTPVFLDVASVISSYTLQSQMDIAAQFYPFSAPGSSANTNRRSEE